MPQNGLLDKLASQPITKEPTKQDIEEYLRQSFPVKEGETLRIVHLWAKNFRIKLYKPHKSDNSVLIHSRLIESKFVQVRVKDGILTHEVLK